MADAPGRDGFAASWGDDTAKTRVAPLIHIRVWSATLRDDCVRPLYEAGSVSLPVRIFRADDDAVPSAAYR